MARRSGERRHGHRSWAVDLPNGQPWQRAMLNVPGLTIVVRDAGDGPQAMMLVASPEVAYDQAVLKAELALALRSRVDRARFLREADEAASRALAAEAGRWRWEPGVPPPPAL